MVSRGSSVSRSLPLSVCRGSSRLQGKGCCGKEKDYTWRLACHSTDLQVPYLLTQAASVFLFPGTQALHNGSNATWQSRFLLTKEESSLALLLRSACSISAVRVFVGFSPVTHAAGHVSYSPRVFAQATHGGRHRQLHSSSVF